MIDPLVSTLFPVLKKSARSLEFDDSAPQNRANLGLPHLTTLETEIPLSVTKNSVADPSGSFNIVTKL